MTRDPNRMGCEEALRQLAAYLDNELGRSDRAQVASHLEMCRSCFSRADFERRLKARIREDLGGTPAPPELEERVGALLRQLRAT